MTLPVVSGPIGRRGSKSIFDHGCVGVWDVFGKIGSTLPFSRQHWFCALGVERSQTRPPDVGRGGGADGVAKRGSNCHEQRRLATPFGT